MSDDFCTITYDLNAEESDPHLISCMREKGHVGSHISQSGTPYTASHISVWDNEMFFDFYAPDGIAASVQTLSYHTD